MPVPSCSQPVTIGAIKRVVCGYYGVALDQMIGARRARHIARPRQVAMYLARQMTGRSLPEIGRQFGNRDHTTVIHADFTIARLIEKDSGMARDVERITKEVVAAVEAGVAAIEDIGEAAKTAAAAVVARAKNDPALAAQGPLRGLRGILREGYGEMPAARGKDAAGRDIEILVAPDGSWSILRTTDDLAVMIASGSGWRRTRARIAAEAFPE